MTAQSSTSASPTAHAIGGSLGSALALLLFYPLERARIELQSRAAAADSGREENNSISAAQSSSTDHADGQRRPDEQIPSPENSDTSSSSFDMVDRCGGGETGPLGQNDVETNKGPAKLEAPSEVETAQKQIQQSDSVWSCLVDLHQRGELYRGVKPVVTTIGISNYVFFYALSVIKKLLAADRNGKAGNNTGRNKAKTLLASSLAGVINVLFTNPLWVANLRIVQGRKRARIKHVHEPSLFEMVGKIAKEEGIGHLWSGTWASVLLVSNPVIQFFSYEQLRLVLLGRRSAKERRLPMGSLPTATLSPVEAFVIGAVAKTMATAVTYPVQLAQTVLRLQEKSGSSQPQQEQQQQSRSTAIDEGTLQCLARLYEEGGISAIYKGMNAKLLQTVLTASFMFLTYEQILALTAYVT